MGQTQTQSTCPGGSGVATASTCPHKTSSESPTPGSHDTPTKVTHSWGLSFASLGNRIRTTLGAAVAAPSTHATVQAEVAGSAGRTTPSGTGTGANAHNAEHTHRDILALVALQTASSNAGRSGDLDTGRLDSGATLLDVEHEWLRDSYIRMSQLFPWVWQESPASEAVVAETVDDNGTEEQTSLPAPEHLGHMRNERNFGSSDPARSNTVQLVSWTGVPESAHTGPDAAPESASSSSIGSPRPPPHTPVNAPGILPSQRFFGSTDPSRSNTVQLFPVVATTPTPDPVEWYAFHPGADGGEDEEASSGMGMGIPDCPSNSWSAVKGMEGFRMACQTWDPKGEVIPIPMRGKWSRRTASSTAESATGESSTTTESTTTTSTTTTSTTTTSTTTESTATESTTTQSTNTEPTTTEVTEVAPAAADESTSTTPSTGTKPSTTTSSTPSTKTPTGAPFSTSVTASEAFPTDTTQASAMTTAEATPRPRYTSLEVVLDGETMWLMIDRSAVIPRPKQTHITFSGYHSERWTQEWATYSTRYTPPAAPAPAPTGPKEPIYVGPGHPLYHIMDHPEVVTMLPEPSDEIPTASPTATLTATLTAAFNAPTCDTATPWLVASAHTSPLDMPALAPNATLTVAPASGMEDLWAPFARNPVTCGFVLVAILYILSVVNFPSISLPRWKLPNKYFQRINDSWFAPIQCMRCGKEFAHNERYEILEHEYKHKLGEYENAQEEHRAKQNLPKLAPEAPHPYAHATSAHNERVVMAAKDAFKYGVRHGVLLELDGHDFDPNRLHHAIEAHADKCIMPEEDWPNHDNPPLKAEFPRHPGPRPVPASRRLLKNALDALSWLTLFVTRRTSGHWAAFVIYTSILVLTRVIGLPFAASEAFMGACIIAWAFEIQSLPPTPVSEPTEQQKWEAREVERKKKLDEILKSRLKEEYPPDIGLELKKKREACTNWNNFTVGYPGRAEAKECEHEERRRAAEREARDKLHVEFVEHREYKFWQHGPSQCGGAQFCTECAEKEKEKAAESARRRYIPPLPLQRR
ncbi:hypothetical protein Q8F55_007590 [Vanrija albida]|uniref:C2H2-type domain-containing protein n=1 Tax=Vanrija albida TaxID=181172 RepID=A0ABR3PTY3_9TREE